ncbi:MAG: helix-turn-helix domain-containing protein [Candidatus Hydrogenedentota bacterium]|nr:MAG: helix-turn-helix domain-containing protein [Candidatus Hydrogenedentota bacterium]
MLSTGPGKLLKEARESKGISLRQAAEETKITSRHLQALEEDNFSLFPGETYVLGFLKSYAEYLDLDPEHIASLYRGALMAEKEVPLAELTKPTMTPWDLYRDKIMLALKALIGVAFIGIIIYWLFSSSNNLHIESTPINETVSLNEKQDTINVPVGVETTHIKLRSGFSTAVLRVGEGINFSLDNVEVYLVLENLNHQYAAEGGSTAELSLYPGKKPIVLKESDPVWIQEDFLPRKFRLTLTGATKTAIKLQIDLGEITEEELAKKQKQETETRITNPENFIIVFDAVVTGPNFVEFYVDGQPRKKGLLAAGSRLHYEANDSIQMKIGDAGAIQVKINGKDYKFGPRGKQVSKVIRKIKDPLESTRFKILVKDL